MFFDECFLSVVIIAVVLTLLLIYLHTLSLHWTKKRIAGPRPLPLVGNLIDYLITSENILELKRHSEYGNIYGSMMGLKPVLHVSDISVVKQIMITDAKYFSEIKSFFADPIMKNSIVQLNGKKWRRLRSIISPSFSNAKLKLINDAVESCVIRHLSHLCKDNLVDIIDSEKFASSFTIDVIAKIFFGLKIDAVVDEKHQFFLNGKELIHFKLWRAICANLFPLKIQHMFDLHVFANRNINYFVRLLRDLIKQRQTKTETTSDFIDLLLDAKISDAETMNLTDNEVIAQCITFLIAGYSTSSAFLEFTLFALTKNQDVQDQLYGEIAKHFNEKKKFSFDELDHLPYMEAVICESLRLYPPSTKIQHICKKDYYLKSKNFVIDKGTTISISIYAIHHDPKIFPEPQKFIPDRFLNSEQQKQAPYSFIPFGCGPRICIGSRFMKMQMKVFLAHLIFTYQLMPTKTTPDIPEYNGVYVSLHCKSFNISFKRREIFNN